MLCNNAVNRVWVGLLVGSVVSLISIGVLTLLENPGVLTFIAMMVVTALVSFIASGVAAMLLLIRDDDGERAR